jgi:NitT/TauT family transport system permease protein
MSRKKIKSVSSAGLNVSAAQQAYIRKHLLLNRRIRIYQILILISFIALWEIGTRVGMINSFVFSSPSRITKTFIDMASNGEIFYHIGITMLETLASFFLVNAIGFE